MGHCSQVDYQWSNFYADINFLNKNKFSKQFIVYKFLSDDAFIPIHEVILGGYGKLPEDECYALESRLYKWLSELKEEEGLAAVVRRIQSLREKARQFQSGNYYQTCDENYHEFPFFKSKATNFLLLFDMVNRLNTLVKKRLIHGQKSLPLKFTSMRQKLAEGLKMLKQDIKTPLKTRERVWQSQVLANLQNELEQNPALYNNEVKTIVKGWRRKLEDEQEPVVFPKWRHHTPTIESAVSIAFSSISVRQEKGAIGAFVTSYHAPLDAAGTAYTERQAYGNYCYVLGHHIEIQAGYSEIEQEYFNETTLENYWRHVNYTPRIHCTHNEENRVWIGFQQPISIFPLKDRKNLSKLFSQNVCLLVAEDNAKAQELSKEIEADYQASWPEKYVIRLVHLLDNTGCPGIMSFNEQLDFIISRTIEDQLKACQQQEKITSHKREDWMAADYVLSDENPFEGLEYGSENDFEGAEWPSSDVEGEEDRLEISENEADNNHSTTTIYSSLIRHQSLERGEENDESIGKANVSVLSDTSIKRKLEVEDEEEPVKKVRVEKDFMQDKKGEKYFEREELRESIKKSLPINRTDLSVLLVDKKATDLLKVYLQAQSLDHAQRKRSKFKSELLTKVATFEVADQLTHLVRTVLPLTILEEWKSSVPRPAPQPT